MKMIDIDGAYLNTSFKENGIVWKLFETESIQHSVKVFALNRSELRTHVLSTTKDTFKSNKGEFITHMRHTIDYKCHNKQIEAI